MRSYSALLVVLLTVFLVAPATPVAAGTGTPAAGPAADPPTFNVQRLAVYPGNNQYVAAWGDQAFLTEGTDVDLYDISDPENPEYQDHITLISGYATVDIDARNGRMAGLARNFGIETILQVFDVSAGYFTKRCNVHFDWGEWNSPQSVRFSISGSYVYVGFQSGLAVVYVDEPVDNECQLKGTYRENDHQYVYDMVQIADPTYGDKLYLGQAQSVTVLSLTDPAYPTFYTSYPMTDAVTSVAVTSNGAIFAGTAWNGLTIFYKGDTRAYLPASRVSIVADGNTVYMGTYTDLQVIEASRLTLPLSQFLPIYGRYTDSYADFYLHHMVVNKGLVHQLSGIYQYRPDLLLEAQNTGVAVNNTPLASGSSIAIKPGDQLTLAAPVGAAALKVQCAANSTPKYLLELRQRVASAFHTDDPDTVINIIEDLAVLGAITTAMCEPQPQQTTRSLTAPPPLPLSLVTGPVQIEVAATAPAVEVDTTYAGSLAAGGTTLQAGHNPTSGSSWFVCLAGSVQVQPTAAGAPLLTLGPGQYVNVTAAGAGPVGQYHYVYLPLLRR